MIRLSVTDRFCLLLDRSLRTLLLTPPTTRPNPAGSLENPPLSSADSRHAAGLMRVNHSGEVCAQALYQGQALTARDAQVRDSLQAAANEENEHLNWCASRLQEEGAKPSRLNPLFYGGSLLLGSVAGLCGDRYSLGFLQETEIQVGRHLTGHLALLPAEDLRSRAIVQQMIEDEASHAELARRSGAVNLPNPVKQLMRLTSKLMTRTAYYG